MTDNPSREIRPDDRWSDQAKEEDEFYLCECGVARTGANAMMKHLKETSHIAELIDATTGDVIGILAGGYRESKYGTQLPDTAHIQRDKKKNEPMFPR